MRRLCTEWDVVLFMTIFRFSGRSLPAKGCYWISRSADGYWYPVLGFSLLFGAQIGKQFLIAQALAFSIEFPLYVLIKNYVRRNRPLELLEVIENYIAPHDRFSFPSGHTAAAFVIATLISHYFPVLIVPCYGWAVLVAYSRISLGVHYPSDTLAGMVLGVASANAGLAFAI